MLLTDVRDGTAVLTLNRPEVRNALSAEVVSLLDNAIADLDRADEVRVIILTGSDPAFCAGFDLRRLSTEPVGTRRSDIRQARPGMLADHATPIIGAVNGPAVTGGLELALACDLLIASERARFADTHARVGAMPGGGLTVRLPQLIGINRARQMSLTGDFIDARQAYEWGLLNEVVAHEHLLPRAHEIAGAIASIPPANIAEVRRTYDITAQLRGAAALRTENQMARHWMASRFDQERLSAERAAIVQRGRGQV